MMSNSDSMPGASTRFSTTLNALLRNLATTGRGRKQALSILADSVIAIMALWLAYTLRFGMPFSDFRHTWYLFLLMPVVSTVAFAGLGVYRWVVRSSNQRLFKQLVKGAALSSLVLLAAYFLIPPERVNPRSIFFLYGVLLTVGVVSVRLLWQAMFDAERKGEPVAIFGAGSAGQQLVGLMALSGEYQPAAFIDDNIDIQGSMILGLPVLNPSSDSIKTDLMRLEVCHVVLAMPSISSALYQEKLSVVAELDLPALTMPSIVEIMTGKARADDIRDVSINDILGRSEVQPDVDLMCKRITGQTVLVTGGGGSIGSELCRQIMHLAPRHLLILDNSEANLYHITEEFEAAQRQNGSNPSVAFTPVLGSVTDAARVGELMAEHAIDTVYHAAAYKHVPIVEAQPDQGVEVNVFGTLTVLDAAITHGVSDFVLISTDKAVRPTNAMGASKRVAELVLQAKAQVQETTRISMVRFGNVLGSSGSVVPKFKKQIEAGGPITLTHKDITRYFMTIPEAAQLVLQASAIAKGGDVFVLDMGEPVRIEQLAETMVRLYGRRLQSETGDPQDIGIQIQGLRPGEKLYEELFISGQCQDTEVAKISTTTETSMPLAQLSSILDDLKHAVDQRANATIKSIILDLAFLGLHREQEQSVCDSAEAIQHVPESDETVNTDSDSDNFVPA